MILLAAQPFGSGDFLLAPNAALTPGDYVLTDHTACEEFGITGPQVAFTVGPAAPMPSGLGALTAIPQSVQPIELSTSLGACSVQTPVAAAQIELTPSDAALAWLDVLHFETWVDGKRWQYLPSSVAVVPPVPARSDARAIACSTSARRWTTRSFAAWPRASTS